MAIAFSMKQGKITGVSDEVRRDCEANFDKNIDSGTIEKARKIYNKQIQDDEPFSEDLFLKCVGRAVNGRW